MTFRIEKDVPMPDKVAGKGARSKYPFAQMKIGDSFLVPCTNGRINNVQVAVVGAAANYRKKAKVTAKFSSSRQPDGVRIWRVA